MVLLCIHRRLDLSAETRVTCVHERRCYGVSIATCIFMANVNFNTDRWLILCILIRLECTHADSLWSRSETLKLHNAIALNARRAIQWWNVEIENRVTHGDWCEGQRTHPLDENRLGNSNATRTFSYYSEYFSITFLTACVRGKTDDLNQVVTKQNKNLLIPCSLMKIPKRN